MRTTPGVTRLRQRLGRLLVYAIVLGYAASLLLPLYGVVVSSFKTNQTIFLAPLALPQSLSLDLYATAQHNADLIGALARSAAITIGAELLTLLLAILAAFGIARIRSRLSNSVELVFGLGFLIPSFAVLVPTYLLAVVSGLLHTLLFLVLFYPATVLPLSVLLIAQFMRAIPREIEESAVIDGASRLRILWHIILPLSMPGIATVAILNFLSFWNEYIFALILTNESSRTVQVALPFLKEPTHADYALLSAGIVMTVVPVFIVYAVLRRRMQEALTAGALKG